MNQRKQLTPEDIKASENLQRIWTEYKAEHKITQEAFVEKSELGGMTQAAFSGYLNKHAAIGLKVLVRLANALECNCSDIREELKDRY